MALGFKGKVLGILAAMAAVFVLLGAVGWFWISSSLRAVDTVEEMNGVLATVGQMSRRMTEVRTSVVAHVGATTNADYRKQLDARIAELDQMIATDLDTLAATAHTADEQQTVQNLRDAWKSYRDSAERTLQLSRRYDLVAAQQNMTTDAAQKFDALLQVIRDLEAASQADARAVADRAHAQLALLRYAMVGAAGLAVAAFVVGFLVLRPVLRTVSAVARASERLAEEEFAALETALGQLAAGDLTGRFVVTTEPLGIRGRDELARMAQAFDRMLERLRVVSETFGRAVEGLSQLVGQVRIAVGQVHGAGSQAQVLSAQIAEATTAVARTVQGVAQGSARQAEQVSAASTAVDEMSQTIQAVAKAAQEQGRALQRATELVQQMAERNQRAGELARVVTERAGWNREQAESGGAVVERTLGAMERVRVQVEATARAIQELGERSKQIGQIVEVINDLTEQTNLLALNAAIEAARAGEAGKGFAVVAEEVRKLAERSAASTQEIAQMVQGIQRTVEQAVGAMAESAGSVTQVSDEAREVGQVFQAIRQAAEEVAERNRELLQVLEEIAKRSAELRATMEDTAAIAEENAASASELASTAEQVRGAIRQVTGVAEQNAAAAEEVSAATEEMATQVGGIAAAAEELVGLAGQLATLVERFRVAVEERGSVPVPVRTEAAAAANGHRWDGEPAGGLAVRSMPGGNGRGAW